MVQFYAIYTAVKENRSQMQNFSYVLDKFMQYLYYKLVVYSQNESIWGLLYKNSNFHSNIENVTVTLLWIAFVNLWFPEVQNYPHSEW